MSSGHSAPVSFLIIHMRATTRRLGLRMKLEAGRGTAARAPPALAGLWSRDANVNAPLKAGLPRTR